MLPLTVLKNSSVLPRNHSGISLPNMEALHCNLGFAFQNARKNKTRSLKRYQIVRPKGWQKITRTSPLTMAGKVKESNQVQTHRKQNQPANEVTTKPRRLKALKHHTTLTHPQTHTPMKHLFYGNWSFSHALG